MFPESVKSKRKTVVSPRDGLAPGLKLAVEMEWPNKEGVPPMIEEHFSFPLKPEEVPGAERALEFVNKFLQPYDDCSWRMPVLTGMRIVRDREGWRLETEGWLTRVVEEDESDD